MSTIIATTLSNGSVSVPTATVVNGSAKAWVNFNGTGTIAARDSFNVASLTDTGTGLYRINLTNSMSNINYCLTMTKQNLSVNLDFGLADDFSQRTVSSFLAASLENGVVADSNNFNSHLAGDLA